jgi:hypothetical protein
VQNPGNSGNFVFAPDQAVRHLRDIWFCLLQYKPVFPSYSFELSVQVGPTVKVFIIYQKMIICLLVVNRIFIRHAVGMKS